VSVSPALPADNTFVRVKRAVESALRSSDLQRTVLQPAAFMEVHCGPALGWDFEKARARILGAADVPRSYVSLHDIALVAVAAALDPAPRIGTCA
jgi:uncharacterized protein YbjT (DUF2867 family)